MRQTLLLVGLSLLAACTSQTVFVDGPAPADNDAAVDPTQSDSDSGPKAPKPGQDSGATTLTDSSTTAPDTSPPNDGFDQFQHRNLDDINKYRAGKGVAALKLDAKLSTFALAGSQQLTQDHTPHQHFINAGNNNTLWSSGFISSAGENQGDPNGWTVLSQNATTNEVMQIDAIQLAMYNEGPGVGEAHGHYMNMMNPKFTRVGVGLIEVSGHLYLTNDFSD